MKSIFPSTVALSDIQSSGKGTLSDTLALEFTELGPDFLKGALIVDKRHLRPGGIVNGGVYLAMIETVASVAARCVIHGQEKNSLGIQVSADYWGYDYANYYNYSYLPIGITGNYHVKLENKKIDLFGGAGLGYSIINCSYDGPGGDLDDLCEDGSAYFIFRVGGRYFFSDKTAFYADLGSGSSNINLGLTFRIK